jgi:hypothetical protein
MVNLRQGPLLKDFFGSNLFRNSNEIMSLLPLMKMVKEAPITEFRRTGFKLSHGLHFPFPCATGLKISSADSGLIDKIKKFGNQMGWEVSDKIRLDRNPIDYIRGTYKGIKLSDIENIKYIKDNLSGLTEGVEVPKDLMEKAGKVLNSLQKNKRFRQQLSEIGTDLKSPELKDLDKIKQASEKFNTILDSTLYTNDLMSKFAWLPFTSGFGENFGGKAVSPVEVIRFKMRSLINELQLQKNIIRPNEVKDEHFLKGGIEVKGKFEGGLNKFWQSVQEARGTWSIICNLPKNTVHRKKLAWLGPKNFKVVGVLGGVEIQAPSGTVTGKLKQTLEGVKDYCGLEVTNLSHGLPSEANHLSLPPDQVHYDIPKRFLGLPLFNGFGKFYNIPAVTRSTQAEANLIEGNVYDAANYLKDITKDEFIKNARKDGKVVADKVEMFKNACLNKGNFVKDKIAKPILGTAGWIASWPLRIFGLA